MVIRSLFLAAGIVGGSLFAATSAMAQSTSESQTLPSCVVSQVSTSTATTTVRVTNTCTTPQRPGIRFTNPASQVCLPTLQPGAAATHVQRGGSFAGLVSC